ncbi:hypothetical protein ABMA28_012650 [Loxostege sticticalis]|uniref:Uncharacterized protein n=1 Tax=Loxostege sticticalis TaxID=481309 RepID=A0ABD0S4J0_LOXSC
MKIYWMFAKTYIYFQKKATYINLTLEIRISLPTTTTEARWNQKKTYDLKDNMGWSDKQRMFRIRQITDIREYHEGIQAFDIGVVMGGIREKYRGMVEIYREYRDKHTGRSMFFPPSFEREFKVEIDKYVHILEAIDDEVLNPDPRYAHVTRTRRRGFLREGDLEIIRRMAAEQKLKSSLREQHLQRKLHLDPAQHTSAKRFQRQWPVEQNWDLGIYGDMGLYGAH